MTKRIFRSILGVSLIVLAASLVLVTGVLHGYFQGRMEPGAAQPHRLHCPWRGADRSGLSDG